MKFQSKSMLCNLSLVFLWLVCGVRYTRAQAMSVAEYSDRLFQQAIQAGVEEAAEIRAGHVLMGLEVAPLRRATLGRSLPLKNKAVVKEGVVLVSVHSASAAKRAGLGVGDIVTSIDGEAVKSVDDFNATLRKFAAAKPKTLRCQVSGFTLVKGKYRTALVMVGPVASREAGKSTLTPPKPQSPKDAD